MQKYCNINGLYSSVRRCLQTLEGMLPRSNPQTLLLYSTQVMCATTCMSPFLPGEIHCLSVALESCKRCGPSITLACSRNCLRLRHRFSPFDVATGQRCGCPGPFSEPAYWILPSAILPTAHDRGMSSSFSKHNEKRCAGEFGCANSTSGCLGGGSDEAEAPEAES